MKIKAFSKEGLQAPQKDNPQERAKTEMRDNINKQVEQLETQVGRRQAYDIMPTMMLSASADI